MIQKGELMMKKVLIILIAIIVIAFGINLFLPNAVRTTGDLPKINYTETFNQDKPEYFVYFWQENCSFCKLFEPDILEAHRNGVPIFVVDIARTNVVNLGAWYDWDAHHEEHDVVIGNVINGQHVLNEGEDEALYPAEEGWSIEVQPNGEIVAVLNRAFNNLEPQTAEEIEIAGTPSLIRIKNGQFAGFATGGEEGLELLNQFGK